MPGNKRASSTRGWAAVVAAWFWASSAFAQAAPDESTLAAARQLGQEGVALYEQGNYAGASEKLERAYAVVKVPTLGLWSGRAFEKLGKLVEASQRFREVTLIALKPSDPAVLRTAQADAQKAYDALANRIPQLTVTLEGASPNDTSVTIDGKAVPSALIGVAVPVNPGTRAVEGRRGADVQSQQIAIREGEHLAVSLTFAAAAPVAPAPAEVRGEQPAAAPANAIEPATSEPHRASILPWVVVGAGGALAVTGVVFLAMSASARSNVESAADGTHWSSVQSDYDHVPLYSGIGLALLGAGAAAITTGLVWKFAGSDQGESAAHVALGPSRLTLEGTF